MWAKVFCVDAEDRCCPVWVWQFAVSGGGTVSPVLSQTAVSCKFFSVRGLLKMQMHHFTVYAMGMKTRCWQKLSCVFLSVCLQLFAASGGSFWLQIRTLHHYAQDIVITCVNEFAVAFVDGIPDQSSDSAHQRTLSWELRDFMLL